MRPRKSLLEGLGVRRMPRQTLPHRRTERGFKSRTCALSESKSGLYDAKSVRQEAKAARLDQRAFALKLYRAILMTHRRVLPPDMAEFGNMYLRDEWKKHKDADIEHLGGFFEQWMQYLQRCCYYRLYLRSKFLGYYLLIILSQQQYQLALLG